MIILMAIKLTTLKKYYLIGLLYFVLLGMLFGQMAADSSFLNIEQNLLTQLAAYPQEKIHLHTDRDFYVPGEKIWFKAYLTDAATHLSPTNIRYVYVELIDTRDSLPPRLLTRGKWFGVCNSISLLYRYKQYDISHSLGNEWELRVGAEDIPLPCFPLSQCPIALISISRIK